MKRKKNNYFLKRFVKQENIAYELSEKKQEQLKKIYREARRELESDLAFFIERYSKENEFTAADLKKMLNTKEKAEFRYSIKGYIEEIERLGKDSKEAKMLKKELDIMAGRTRISRKQELLTSINYELSKASLKTNNEIKKHLTDVVEFVIKDTHKIISGNTLTKLDPKLIENIVNQKWDNKNYSSRVWSNKKGLADKVIKHITTGFIQGHDYKKMSDRLVKDMNVGYYEARRILQTETTGAIENAKAQTFKDLGVTKYKFIATMDDRTSEICRSLDGQIFDMKDRQIGVNCPFMHPFCRSVTVPVVDDKVKDKKLRENSEEALKNNENELTKEEKSVIMKYKSFESIKINEKLRNKHILTEEDKIFIKNLDSALKKIPFYKGDITRSLTFRNNNELSKFLYEMEPDKIITFESYTSASFGEIFNSNAQVYLNIQNSKKARDISRFGLSEDEVLYERDSKFKIIAATVRNNIFYIELEEI